MWTDGWTALSTDGITDVNETHNSTTPDQFNLSQNYPNPFNPSTKITYSIKEASVVNITVFNVLGQEVTQLVNGFRNAGTYEVTFDATELPSGMYLYTLEANGQRFTKKMTLLK